MRMNFKLTADKQKSTCYIAFEQMSQLFAPQELTNRFLRNCRIDRAILSEGVVKSIREEYNKKLNKLPKDHIGLLKEMRYELSTERSFGDIIITFDTGLEKLTTTISPSGKFQVTLTEY